MLASNIKTTDTRYGPMAYYADDLFIGPSLEKYGEYSKAESDLWRQLIKPGATVLDIGANIGALTLPLAEIVGLQGKVYAFEPQPETYELLVRNADATKVSSAGFAEIWCGKWALSDQTGFVNIAPLSSVTNRNYGGFELRDVPDGTPVSVITLDSMMLDRVDFMKIDVEGMEAQVLAGSLNTIKRCRPILYVENDREENSDQLIRLIQAQDYTICDHRPLLYADDNFKKNYWDRFTDRPIISLNLLCIPNEKVDEFKEVIKPLAKIGGHHGGVVSTKEWACIVRLGGIGDDLVAASTVRPLKKMGYMVEVITQLPQAVVFENNPYIDKITLKDSKRDIPQSNQMEWQKYWWARSCEYARFANLSHSMEVLLAQYPESTAFWWAPKMRRKICGQSYLEAAHDVVDIPYDFGPMFFPTEAERKDIEDFLQRHKLKQKPVVAWCIKGTRLDKVYPMAALAIARMITELDVNVLMLSAPHPHPDGPLAEQVYEHVKLNNSSERGVYDIRTINLNKPEWPIRRMLTLAQMCDLVIGPDTGPMWAVAMEPVPKIMLHSHASVENIAKHWLNTISLHAAPEIKCWPCHLLHSEVGTCQETQLRSGVTPNPEAHGAACISSITVNQILSATKQQLQSRR